MKPSTAIAILHHPDDTLGSLPELLDERGIQLHRQCVTDPLPAAEHADLFFIMGSAESAHDDTLPWIQPELIWLEQLLAVNKPMLGICFGSQIIARAMGGKALPLSQPEIGFITVEPATPAWHHPGPWLNFHFDTFQLPADVTLLGVSDQAFQSYRRGNCWAVQFHPEIDSAMYASWLAYWQASPKGHAFLTENASLVAQIGQQIHTSEARCRQQFRALLDDFISTCYSAHERLAQAAFEPNSRKDNGL